MVNNLQRGAHIYSEQFEVQNRRGRVVDEGSSENHYRHVIEPFLKTYFHIIQTSKHIAKEANFIPDKALYDSKVSNEIQCFTNFEPRADSTAMNLSSLIVTKNGWKENVFENFIHPSILQKSKERGYTDVKYLLYGNKDSGLISFEIIGNLLFIVQACSCQWCIISMHRFS